ncbi:MAG: cytochrome c [Candidatus Hinthialibacter antarcticus]|nr:cytochrome c [Candidatus Hinthialibacter antarcticus]
MSVRAWIICGAVIALIVAAIPVALISKARVTTSKMPRIHLIQNMDNQPRMKSQQYSVLFADRRAMRPQVDGTVARGELDLADGFHTGAVGEEWVKDYPVPVTDLLIQRGEEKYEINCAICHGYAGFGDGMVNKRAEQLQQPAWIQPSSFHTDEIRNRDNGHIFNTITNGIRTMPSYRDKLSPKDRWAVVAYVRALQRSQNAALEDIPQDVLSDQN